MATNMSSPTTSVSSEVGIAIVSISLVSIIINACYITICIKTLKKDFYRLSVLCLMLSDCFLGISSGWFGLSMVTSIQQHVGVCILQIFTVVFSLLTTFTMIFLICLQRYIAVKSYNYASNVQHVCLNRHKYLFSVGTVGFLFAYTLGTTLITPHQDTTPGCSLTVVYGEHFIYFFVLTFGAISALMFTIIIFTAKTGFHIWRIFFCNKIRPATTKERVEKSNGDIKMDDLTPSTSRNDVQDLSQMSVYSISISLDSVSFSVLSYETQEKSLEENKTAWKEDFNNMFLSRY